MTNKMTNKAAHFKTAYSLHGRLKNIMKLYAELEKIPRHFGTGLEISSAEIHTIELIGENPGLSVTALAKIQGVTKGAVSQTLKRLEAKELTTKEDDPENSSRSQLKLTNKGNIAYYSHKHWHENMDGGFKKYFENMEQEKIDFLDEVLSKMEDFLKLRIQTEQ